MPSGLANTDYALVLLMSSSIVVSFRSSFAYNREQTQTDVFVSKPKCPVGADVPQSQVELVGIV
eukprot:5470726-Amphidinium_carterae.1